MRKYFFILIGLFFISNFNYAQGVMLAGKVGTNISKIRSNRTSDFTYKPNLTFGVAFEAATNDLFSLQTECNYSLISSKYQSTTVNLSYVDIPILAKFSTGKNNRFFFNFGPMISVLANAKEKGPTNIIDGSFEPAENSNERNVYRYLNDSNFSMVFGIGAIVQNIMIDFRYTTGISDISRVNGEDLSISRFDITCSYALIF
ncbi:PorT family protein [Flammeovirga sp. MY04]|uniref:porin family protein n=1 Tax=Flammeovirga sp. MY04 TaxID=1191459 RepID=UPI0008061E3D|nr:porin family protein [Flammeovirga sp. MY04]ANQ48480.1 PorT family protein [Flammeovirga sp. MY04]